MKTRIKIFTLLSVFIFILPAQPLKQKLENALNNLPHPESVLDFAVIPHLSSRNQDSTLICWSFATSSFLESEMHRLGKEPVRLSVMFSVYYGFIEKAKRFVQTQGQSQFGPGDLFSGVLDIIKQYGAVPADAYEGNKTAQTVYNHNALYIHLESLIKKIKAEKNWKEEYVLEQIKAILNKQLGIPPEKFLYKGKTYTPQSFKSEIINLPWDDYIIVTSFQYAPFYRFVDLKVPDNWKCDSNFFNVPLIEFYASLTKALDNGFTAAIDMDNSEASYRITKRYAFVPEFDVQKNSITQTKREEQFQSGSTTDDHVMHIVSFKKIDGEDWFLAKDSWRTAWEEENHGYFFFHETYVKLKVLAYLVNKNAVPEITRLIPKK